MSDASIKNVIDNKAGPHLINIRTKLGLSQHALIIPSDVHDHFVDEKVMRQDTFVGATGGNILDEEHVGELIKCLNDSGDKKSAAALFYHAHVICIVKMRVGKEVRTDGSWDEYGTKGWEGKTEESNIYYTNSSAHSTPLLAGLVRSDRQPPFPTRRE